MRRTIIEIDEERCNGCGQCVTACAEGAIQIIDGKARLVSERYCDGLGACLGECPQDAIRIVERDAAAFDEVAAATWVKQHMANAKKTSVSHVCPSQQARTFVGPQAGAAGGYREACAGGLGHWPIQIRLISPNAPFLAGADVLVAADCVPAACPEFHVMAQGKVVMIGCPKFDDAELYIERFADIFRCNSIHRVTVAVMEVPCCQSLPAFVTEGMERAGVAMELTKVVIALDGKVLGMQSCSV